jgi:FKBP-type peptidyl-prolyl cis-trans isomerase SlyD
MQIDNNKVVTVTYNLQSNLPEQEKEHVETADEKNPLQFIYGAGMMIPGFEKGLEGKNTGDDFSFSIDPEDAYGTTDETAVINLPIDIFKVDDVIDFNILKVGNTLPMSDNQGNVLNGRVVKFDDQSVTMDFNHPLAGHQLHFSGKIVDVREASAEELEHGHVH